MSESGILSSESEESSVCMTLGLLNLRLEGVSSCLCLSLGSHRLLEDEGVALFDELESLLYADNGLGALAQPVKNRYLMCDIKTKNNLKHVRSEQDLPIEFFLWHGVLLQSRLET